MQKIVCRDLVGETVNKMITIMRMLENADFETASRYLYNEHKNGNANAPRILEGVRGFAKKGFAFTEYYIDHYGSNNLSGDQRRQFVEGQKKVDELAMAEQRRGRKEEIQAQISSIEEQIRLLQESLKLKRQELDGR